MIFLYINLAELKNKANSLTTKPGVYLMKDSKNRIIYIGKAKNLKNRVSSYFRNLSSHNERIHKLIENIFDFDFIVTNSEFDALILECSLIKQNKPKYNVLLKDSKGFCYIKITTNLKFPKIEVVKNKENDGATYLGPYIQYSHLFPLKQAVKNVNEIFMLPDCKLKLSNNFKKRPCLNYYIKKCSGVCCGKISETDYLNSVNEAIDFLKNGSKSSINLMKKQMNQAANDEDFELAIKLRDRIKIIKKISNDRSSIYLKKVTSMHVISAAILKNFVCFVVVKYLQGRINGLQHFICEDIAYMQSANLKEEIEEFVANYYYGKDEDSYDTPAFLLVDCDDFNVDLFSKYLKQQFVAPVKIRLPSHGKKFRILTEMARSNAIEILNTNLNQNSSKFQIMNELSEILKLKVVPKRIEAYDISNLGSSSIVGVMVVFQNGLALKKDYRKFKIKTVMLQNDYASIEEVLKRRINRFKEQLDSSFSQKPDLILIDGGSNHVTIAKEVLNKENFDVPCFGMVKDSKHRTKSLASEYGPIEMIENRNLFYFITKIQDEVHRFAIEYNRKVRQKTSFQLELTKIKGIGEQKAINFLNSFDSEFDLKSVSLEEIEKKLNVKKEIAEDIKNLINFLY